MAWRPLAQPQLPDFYRTELANQQLLGNALKEGFNLITHKVIENDLAERYGDDLYSPEALQERVVKYSMINPDLAKMFSNQLYTSELAKSRLQTAAETKDYKDERQAAGLLTNINATNSQRLQINNAIARAEQNKSTWLADPFNQAQKGSDAYNKEIATFDKQINAFRNQFKLLDTTLDKFVNQYERLTGTPFARDDFTVDDIYTGQSLGGEKKGAGTGNPEDDWGGGGDPEITETGEGDEEEEDSSPGFFETLFNEARAKKQLRKELRAQVDEEWNPELKQQFGTKYNYFDALYKQATRVAE